MSPESASDPLAMMRAAIAAAPDDVAARLEFGKVLGAHQRLEEAAEEFRRVVDAKPNWPDGWFSLGMAHYTMRREAEAVLSFQRALALVPDQPMILRALAESEFALEQYDEALNHFERVAELVSEIDAVLHLRLVQCQRRRGSVGEALVNAMNAVACFPDDAFLWMELGGLHEDLGEAAPAEEAYARARGLRPTWADPVGASLALMRSRAPGELVELAIHLTELEGLPTHQSAYLHYVLGKRYDLMGEYSSAANHWIEANRLRRLVDGGFDRGAYRAQIDTLAEVFTKELLTSRPATLEDERPVFVVGMPRSGTTLVEQVIASHPSAYGCGELSVLPAAVESLSVASALAWPSYVASCDAAELRQLAQRYLQQAARTAGPDKRRLVDKYPQNFLNIGLISMLFARARIVWCRREPRDTALSIYSESFAPRTTFATDFGDIAFVFGEHERLMRHWQAVVPLPILEVQYEDVVADPDAQIRRLIDFVGLPWDSRCAEFYQTRRAVQTHSRWQVREPVHARSVGRWRNYADWFVGMV